MCYNAVQIVCVGNEGMIKSRNRNRTKQNSIFETELNKTLYLKFNI